MKTKRFLAIILTVAVIGAIALLSGCSKAPAEDETAEITAPLFQKGVWSASIDGAIGTYFLFEDE